MIEHLGEQWEQDCFSDLNAYMQENMVRSDFSFGHSGERERLINPVWQIPVKRK